MLRKMQKSGGKRYRFGRQTTEPFSAQSERNAEKFMNAAPNISPKEILRTAFGYRSFREHQEDIIHHLLSGGDAFVLMPTGSGKSLCYQIPSILRSGVGIVVSPLIALMQDQTEGLRQMGIRADFINSALSYRQMQETRQRLLSGNTDILYVAPERLMTPEFQDLLTQFPIALFAIDEAHCISQWGHDFRPEYMQISRLTQHYPGVPRIALTATADPLTRREIIERLFLQKARQFISSFDRPNIRYRVQPRQKGMRQLADFLKGEHAGNSGLIYCRSRKQTEQTAQLLVRAGYKALAYHAGMDNYTRAEHQRRFLREDEIIIVATVAFGMGIDKPDVRFVVHMGMPQSMEAYYQETGRAGRDGNPADAWMLYGLSDIVMLRRMADESSGNAHFKRVRKQKAESMLGYCESTYCRRHLLLRYFGEDYPKDCGNCDVCLGMVESWDGSLAAQKALSCVYRTGQSFGAAHLTDVLLGISNEKVLRFRHDRVSTFGIGTEHSADEWKSIIRQLAAAGFLYTDVEKKGGFALSPQSRPVLRGEQKVVFRKDTVPRKIPRPAKKKIGEDITDPFDLELWEKLRELRREMARASDIPPYAVFQDTTLRAIIDSLPRTLTEMGEIQGIGRKKQERYGPAFLEVIQTHIREKGLPEDRQRGKQNAGGPPPSTALLYHSDTINVTFALLQKGLSPEEIAAQRELKVSTIYSHLSKLIESNDLSAEEVIRLPPEEVRQIEAALRALPEEQRKFLKPVFNQFEGRYDYGLLRCIRADLWGEVE